ncbi:MAG: glycosyltransferase family 39 protein [Candidatus Omnitrophica bacterium]|jgi:hypothetical protein|nr:glycosyltransferase family 39 protein [Candidatus Omnitrophota bacterium]
MIYAGRNKQKIALALFFLYFFLALGYGLVTGRLYNNQFLPSDALFYKISGYNLSRGLGYTFDGITPHGIYQIGYPLFLGGLFTVFGSNLVPVLITQYILGAINIVLFFLILDSTLRSDLVKYIALFLYLTHHVIFYLTSMILSETLGIFFFLSFILLSVKYFSSPKTKWILLASISCGCLILVRNKFQLLPLFLLAVSFLVGRRKFFQKAFLLFLVSFIIISPVLIRNKIVFGRYRLSFHGGEFFYRGIKCSPAEDNHSKSGIKQNIATIDERYFKLFLDNLQEHPVIMFKNYINNFTKLNFPFRVLDSRKNYSFLRRSLIAKNIIVFLIIVTCLLKGGKVIVFLKKRDLIFMGLLFLYDNAVTSFGITDDLRLGLFSHILMYLIFALIIDSVYIPKLRK